EAVALLGEDPLRLKQYIQLYHPELDPETADSIAIAGSMRGLRTESQVEEELHQAYTVNLPAPIVRTNLTETSGHAIKVEGTVQPNVRYVQVAGVYTRKIVV